MTIVKDEQGNALYYDCKYCGEDNGSFNGRTGNHRECERVARLESALKRIEKLTNKANKWLFVTPNPDISKIAEIAHKALKVTR